MYQILKFFLFKISPEKAHQITTRLLRFVLRIPLGKYFIRKNYAVEDNRLQKNVFGLIFENPVGLAAGFDKNAELIDDFSHIGFGFIEIGTVTPKGQPGNPQPRLFRLPQDRALINRMGFNNEGADAAVKRLASRKSNLIIGGNIGKNKVTPNDQATEDYLICFDKLYPYVDYFVINVSSPNTPGLRELQEKEPLMKLIASVQAANNGKHTPKPILLKIAPDLNNNQLDDINSIANELKLDGLIVSNTTIDRNDLRTNRETIDQIGAGGLSGEPARAKSTEVLKYIRTANKSIPIIAVGGIMSAADALEKLEAGADLLQIYTGLVYEGPALIKNINKEILRSFDQS